MFRKLQEIDMMSKPITSTAALLSLVLGGTGLLSACSSAEQQDNQAAPVNKIVHNTEEGEAIKAVRLFRSEVGAIAFDAVDKLPAAPASAASQSECSSFVQKPKSAAARKVAAAGWAVTAEGHIGAYQAVSFAGAFEPATSGSCDISKGNIALFEGDRIRAIAYVPAGQKASIGQIMRLGEEGLRIWDGDVAPVPVADMLPDTDGLVTIVKLADQEEVCGGKAFVPNIYGMPIEKARNVLAKANWRPVSHGDAASRSDGREANLANSGVVEVDSCSGTGFGYCGFDYKNGGIGLGVTTIGDDPSVSSYAASCGG
jgi:hypothetical protein